MDAYYNLHSIADVLSLKAVDDIDDLYVTMDTKTKSGIFIEDGTHKLHFKHSPSGLFYCTIEDMRVFFSARQNGNHMSFLSSSTSEHTNDEIARAREARHLQECLMWPSDGELKRILSIKAITGSNVTFKDVERANLIFGKTTEISAGKMTAPVKAQNSSSQISLDDLVTNINRRIKLYLDILFINGDPYLHTKSKDLDYVTINRLDSQKIRDIKKKLKRAILKYLSRGFIITDVFGDDEFQHDTFEDLFVPAILYICSKNEHVPIIEQSTRTVKERARAASTHLPFDRVPKLMTISLLKGVERWLNAFPKDGCSYSPTLLVEGRQNPRGDIKQIAYGSYASVYIGINNNLDSHTVPGIALRDSNGVGGHYFMSLKSGKRIHANKWDDLPITSEVVRRVHELADSQGQLWLHDDPFTLSYLQDDNIRVVDNVGTTAINDQIKEDETLSRPDESQEDTETDHKEQYDYSSGTILEASDSTFTTDSTFSPEESYEGEATVNDIIHNDEAIATVDDSEINSNDFTFNLANAYKTSAEDSGDNYQNANIEESSLDLDVLILELHRTYHDDTSSSPSVQLFNVGDTYKKAIHIMFTQMSAQKGMKLFGKKAVAAMFKELKQFSDGVVPGKPVIEPIPLNF